MMWLASWREEFNLPCLTPNDISEDELAAVIAAAKSTYMNGCSAGNIYFGPKEARPPGLIRSPAVWVKDFIVFARQQNPRLEMLTSPKAFSRQMIHEMYRGRQDFSLNEADFVGGKWRTRNAEEMLNNGGICRATFIEKVSSPISNLKRSTAIGI